MCFTKPYYKSETLSFKKLCLQTATTTLHAALTTFAVHVEVSYDSYLIIFGMKGLINYVDAAQPSTANTKDGELKN
jgi:hypothetical protein